MCAKIAVKVFSQMGELEIFTIYQPVTMWQVLFSAFSSVQFSSVAQSCTTLCDPMNHSAPGLPVHHQLQSLLKPMSIESVMPSSHLILSRPLLLLPPIPPSIRVFSSESMLRIRWPKYWSSLPYMRQKTITHPWTNKW